MTGLTVLIIIVVCVSGAYGFLLLLLKFASEHPLDCECEECEAVRDYLWSEREQ
jgi:hypothetical protein